MRRISSSTASDMFDVKSTTRGKHLRVDFQTVAIAIQTWAIPGARMHWS